MMWILRPIWHPRLISNGTNHYYICILPPFRILPPMIHLILGRSSHHSITMKSCVYIYIPQFSIWWSKRILVMKQKDQFSSNDDHPNVPDFLIKRKMSTTFNIATKELFSCSPHWKRIDLIVVCEGFLRSFIPCIRKPWQNCCPPPPTHAKKVTLEQGTLEKKKWKIDMHMLLTIRLLKMNITVTEMIG
jgi:hypothetical protein